MKDWQEELAELKTAGRYRTLEQLSSAQAPRVKQGSEGLIMLASNNYLGLTTNKQVQARAKEVIEEYGTGAGGSRLTTGNYDLHEELESRLAEFKQTEAALLFNTGYMANLGVLTTVVGKGDLIIADRLSHASIIDGCRLSQARLMVYPHNDLEKLEQILERGNKRYERILIVTDGVFSMDGDLAKIPEIIELAKQYQALVMVDDAHGTGVLGASGRGIREYFNLAGEIDILVGTLSKALASEGGFVAGSQTLIDLLRNKARSFIYSTALAPSVVATSLAALNYLDQHSELVDQLWTKIEYLKSGLDELGYQLLPSQSAIIPILIGGEAKTMKLSKRLSAAGIMAPGIRPPTVPEGSCRIRTTVMANHSRQDLDKAVEAFARVGAELELI
ncbi:MAG: 8-amino-7-oxononanoate synthase [Bacillota bacterium]